MPGVAVTVAGFVDAHSHLLKAAARVPFAWQGTTVAAFHQEVARAGATPMDVGEPAPDGPPAEMAQRLRAGLAAAAAAGLVEVAEMGMRAWWYLDALDVLQREGPLPARVRVYLASGLAEQTGWAELDARRSGAGPWVSLDGVKFYADGWLGSRTCATCRPFADAGGPDPPDGGPGPCRRPRDRPHRGARHQPETVQLGPSPAAARFAPSGPFMEVRLDPFCCRGGDIRPRVFHDPEALYAAGTYNHSGSWTSLACRALRDPAAQRSHCQDRCCLPLRWGSLAAG
jgi:hypothetical protein